MPNKDKILANYEVEWKSIQYLFIEKESIQNATSYHDQAYMWGTFNLYQSDFNKPKEFERFSEQFLEELNYCVSIYPTFTVKRIDMKDYDFGLVDNRKKITIYHQFDTQFYELLKESGGNLLITEKNFDMIGFRTHKVFVEWFEKYRNR
jgi:hypothetical protein